MKVIIGDYHLVYENLHRELCIDEESKHTVYSGVQIIENNNFYFIFDILNTYEIIFILDKNIKEEIRFKKIVNYLRKEKSYNREIIKNNFKKVIDFLLGIMKADQLFLIIKKKEEIAFEKGKYAKVKEFKKIFYIE